MVFSWCLVSKTGFFLHVTFGRVTFQSFHFLEKEGPCGRVLLKRPRLKRAGFVLSFGEGFWWFQSASWHVLPGVFIWLWVKKGYPKNLIGERKNRPKTVVPKGFLFDPQPFKDLVLL